MRHNNHGKCISDTKTTVLKKGQGPNYSGMDFITFGVTNGNHKCLP